MKNFSPKGQGALEYLLLIGGAVLIATVVLVIILGTTGSTNTIISNNLTTFTNKINLGASGGTPAVCGNGIIETGETCDQGSNNVTNGDGCSSTCSVESGYSCVGTPSVCNLIPPSAPSFSFSAATGSGAHQVDLTWNVTSNYDGSAYNVVKGWVGAAPSITDPVSFQSATGEDFLYNVTSASNTAPVFGAVSNVGYTLYMVACNGTATANNSNCTLLSIPSTTSGYDAVLFEAESGTLGSSLLVVTSGGEDYVSTINGSCTAAPNNEFTHLVALDNASTVNYNTWIYATSNNTNVRTLTPYINDFTTNGAPVDVPASSPPAWIQGAPYVAGSNGSSTLTLRILCNTNGLVGVGKVLLTSASCAPVGDGSNCS